MIHDHLVIGAGMAGLSAACELVAHGTTALLEAEDAPGRHATGRSAALYTPNFGNAVVRRLNHAGHTFLDTPPDGFAETPLLRARGALTVAAPGEEGSIDTLVASAADAHPVERVTAAEALCLAPLLRRERVAAAGFEPGVMDIDVDAMQQGFLRAFRTGGGTLSTCRRVDALAHTDGVWTVKAGDTTFRARVVVDAAGAWADEVARLAGVAPVGLVPMRRTAIVVDAPDSLDTARLPLVDFAGAPAYLKPDAGRLMASLGDRTPDEPRDCRPEDFDVASLVDWLERATTLEVRRPRASWAGLRSFVADETPVVGFDDRTPGFFWLAAQGGYGIMMAPALARATASLVSRGRLPEDLSASGLTEACLSPGRAALAGHRRSPC